jgi:hypothetical protein
MSCCSCLVEVGTTGVLPALQFTATCLDSVNMGNSSGVNATLEPSPFVLAGCNRPGVSETFVITLQLVNFHNVSATSCKPFTPGPDQDPSVVAVWEKAIKQSFLFYDPCSPLVEILPSTSFCDDPGSFARPKAQTIELIAEVKVTSPFPCSGRRFISDWVGVAIKKEIRDTCRSSTCLCNGVAGPVCVATQSYLNAPALNVTYRSYHVVESSYAVVNTNAECMSPACQSQYVPIAVCTP